MCHEMGLYAISFRMLYRLPANYQKDCLKLFKKDTLAEKPKTMKDLHSGPTRKKALMLVDILDNPHTIYLVSEKLLSCLSTVDVYVPKPYYLLQEIIVLAVRYIFLNR
jgi:hypothetical protein